MVQWVLTVQKFLYKNLYLLLLLLLPVLVLCVTGNSVSTTICISTVVGIPTRQQLDSNLKRVWPGALPLTVWH